MKKLNILLATAFIIQTGLQASNAAQTANQVGNYIAQGANQIGTFANQNIINPIKNYVAGTSPQNNNLSANQKKQLLNNAQEAMMKDAINQIVTDFDPNVVGVYNPYQNSTYGENQAQIVRPNGVIPSRPNVPRGRPMSIAAKPQFLQDITDLQTQVATMQSQIQLLQQQVADLQNNTTTTDNVAIQTIIPGNGMKAVGVKSDQQNIQYAKSTAQSKK